MTEKERYEELKRLHETLISELLNLVQSLQSKLDLPESSQQVMSTLSTLDLEFDPSEFCKMTKVQLKELVNDLEHLKELTEKISSSQSEAINLLKPFFEEENVVNNEEENVVSALGVVNNEEVNVVNPLGAVNNEEVNVMNAQARE